jgi:hypothetical protein
MFCRHIILGLLRCITENSEVIEGVHTFLEGCMRPTGRILVSPDIDFPSHMYILTFKNRVSYI